MKSSYMWISLCALAVAFAVALYGATLSPSYSFCKSPHTHADATEKQETEQNFIPVSGGTLLECESFVANQNGSAITAIATILLTVVTGILGFIAFMQFAAAKNQARPYVFVLAKEIVQWAPNGPLRIKVVMENLGATPAYEVEWAGTASVEAVPLYREKRFLRKKKFMEIADDIPHSVSPLAREPIWSVDEVEATEFAPEILDALYAGYLGVYSYSRVWHRDVFGGKYIVESCHYIAPDDMRVMIDQQRRGETVVTDHMQVLHAQEFNHLT